MTLEALKDKANKLPKLPGVYIMKDTEGFVIYVGKSKCLKERVSSYFRSLKHAPPKVGRLVAAIDTFESIITDTELDALLLECQLIKQYRPLYNRLLKHDKNYRYINIKGADGFQTLQATYQMGTEGYYYGPYDRHVDLILVVDALKRYFKLPNCSEVEALENCLTYRLNQCNAPCIEGNSVLNVNKINELKAFLEGNNFDIIGAYEALMQQAAESLEFDKAIRYRQIYFALKRLCYRQEAAKLSLAQTKGIALLPMPVGGIKVYLLYGTRIMYTFKLKDTERPSTKLAKIRDAYNKHLCEPAVPLNMIEKHEVDYYFILYSYFKNHEEVKYLQQDDHEEGETFINRLLDDEG